MKPSKALLSIVGEKYPRIAQAIEYSWGTSDGETYLNGLIINDRGSREGFDPEVFSAILKLSNAHPRII